ncbi:formate/nitrite transporter family protein [Demequina iriomotensis]|uniref:formate/nitrite transporter family protein n=1 Tax=Demequina iriomotensis TaxID=1536641 RepID=UPI0009E21900|nr:formate/nitrite transporter family protein [Demequina iriomotensis]
MLTLPDTVDAQADASVAKSRLARTPLRFLVAGMLAGMWVGTGVILMWSAAGPLHVAGHPLERLIGGSVFAIALTTVVFLGGELATSAMMVLPLGALRRRISWPRAGGLLLGIFFANMAGAFVFSWVMVQAGLFTGATGQFAADTLALKISHTPAELFWRGVLCNIMVCGAIWGVTRLKSEAAKAIIIFWCVLAFIAGGYEHVVANMTVFGVGLISGGDVSLAQFGTNMLVVGLGNLVGGAVVIGLAYAFVSGRTRVDEADDAPGAALVAEAEAVLEDAPTR